MHATTRAVKLLRPNPFSFRSVPRLVVSDCTPSLSTIVSWTRWACSCSYHGQSSLLANLLKTFHHDSSQSGPGEEIFAVFHSNQMSCAELRGSTTGLVACLVVWAPHELTDLVQLARPLESKLCNDYRHGCWGRRAGFNVLRYLSAPHIAQ
jgi:hypothetical protein